MITNIPLVSIILPTYNGNTIWISEAIESVLQQTYINRELIIINDGSTNDIEKTILEYTSQNIKIKYIKNTKNMERSYSKNRGIFESQGKYIAFLDDDDFWSDKNKIEKQIIFLEKNPEYGLCGCSVININDDGSHKKVTVRESDREIRNNILKWNQIAQSSVILRKDILLLSGLYDTRMIPSEDYDLWLRVGSCCKLYNINNIYFSYRNRHDNSSHRQKYRQHLNGCISMRRNKQHYPGFFIALILRFGYFILVLIGVKK